MSDLSALDQSFGLDAATVAPAYCEPPPLTDLQPHEVGFRQLLGPAEIARVLHLRSEIQLPTSALTDPGFATREKKETRRASWAPSSARVNTSVPSASCR
jgi:hypothetical protein